MKFECSTEQLLSGATLASRFVQRQQNLPTLSSVLISTQGGNIVLRATNLECGVEVSIPAKISNEGVCAAPAATLVGFLTNTKGKNITTELVGDVLKMNTEHTSASIRTTAYEDFPTLPRVSAEHSFITKAQDFLKALKSVAHCAATSNIKPELQTIAISAEAGKLVSVATDSFRLAEKTIPLKSKGSVPQLLLPARNGVELMRILEGVGGDVEVYYNTNQLSLQVDRIYYTSRLVDGSFPDYGQIIPKSFSTEGVVLREDMANALRGLTVFTDKFSQISFSIEPKKKTIELSSRNADVGEEVCVLKAAANGESVSMNFNSKYVADGLTPISGESVRVQANGPGKPLVIRDASDDSFLYLAMPMNR